MAEIINLRMARKAKQRADAAQTAAENRARLGRNKGEKARDQLTAEQQKNCIDGAHRDGRTTPAGDDTPLNQLKSPFSAS